MSDLTLCVLGFTRIESGGKLRKIGNRRALALLTYLAVTCEDHSREQLAAFFWPEWDHQTGRTYLRHTLWALRKALGADLLLSNQEWVGLRADLELHVDVRAFHEQIDVWRSHNHAADELCADCLPALTTAATLYRDDFLVGFSLRGSANFDEWQRECTEQLGGQLAGVLHRLARYYSAQQEWEIAIAYARRWLKLDTLHEPAHCLLMKVYAHSGQWGAALRQYDECVRVLAQELQAAPSAETTKLLAALKREQQEAVNQPYYGRTQPISADAQPAHNLPASLTPLLGRRDETRALQDLFRTTPARLVTLTGPGGVGKTRLALHVARTLVNDFVDGVHLISLAPVYEPSLMLIDIAQTLSIPIVGSQPLLQAIQDALRAKQVLLMLDNFEHILAAAPIVAELLAAAPQLKVLATSRERLRLYGEQIYPVLPLPLPESHLETTASVAFQAESVQLFVQRAQAVNPDYVFTDGDASAVTAICRRLDGLPLAIELAAARSDQLSPQLLFERLAAENEGQTAWLRSDLRAIPERHRTLHKTLEWSYNLLSVDAQKLLCWLAVFTGGCSVEAVEMVYGALAPASSQLDSRRGEVLDGLSSLVNKSLLQRELQPNGEPRFTLLETIRQFSLGRLQDVQGLTQAGAAHCRYFADFTVTAIAGLKTANKLTWLNRLTVEHDNLRAALKFALDHQAIALALRVGAALWRFWDMRGDIGEGRQWLTELLALPDAAQHPTEEAQILLGLGVLAGQQSDYQLAHSVLERALTIAGALNDQRLMAEIHTHWGTGLRSQGEYVQSQRHHEEALALARAAGDRATIAVTLQSLAKVLDYQGNDAEAKPLLGEALALANEVNDPDLTFQIAFYLGVMARKRGDLANARHFLEKCLALAQETDHQLYLGYALSELGIVRCDLADYSGATSHIRQGLKVFVAINHHWGVAMSLEYLALTAAAMQQIEQAHQLAGAAARLRDSTQTSPAPHVLASLEATLAAITNEAAAAAAATAQTTGEAMSLEAAIQYALDWRP